MRTLCNATHPSTKGDLESPSAEPANPLMIAHLVAAIGVLRNGLLSKRAPTSRCRIGEFLIGFPSNKHKHMFQKHVERLRSNTRKKAIQSRGLCCDVQRLRDKCVRSAMPPPPPNRIQHALLLTAQTCLYGVEVALGLSKVSMCVWSCEDYSEANAHRRSQRCVVQWLNPNTCSRLKSPRAGPTKPTASARLVASTWVLEPECNNGSAAS